ncbi:Myotubularin- protein 6 [Clonorchis sinensis]|uniref:Myotubularin-related protein 6 n=2 Tax=Clonorchis sinensis TaxID=79923 RepID=G7YA27_CLOSI|nr:Myotubularin- protein 6 [Clonorchis sinensis]GAA49811.1 myotubularin-related protein 6 [Clonorchis sinensis]
MDRLRLTQVNDVFYLDPFDGKVHVRGTLHLTLTHIFFVGVSRKQEVWLNTRLIASVERLPLTTGGAPLVIRGKNFRIIHLVIPRERDCHDVYTTVQQLRSIEHITELPCFRLLPAGCYWDRADGWNTFDMQTQFERFGLPNAAWTLTDINRDFQICDTYPTVLSVPATVSRAMLHASARFRSRGRFPVLTYLHPNGQSALCRSSQPLAGFASKCIDDQLLLEAIRLANPNQSPLYVVDARPALNALTNRAQGKGYEDVTVYRNIVIQFFDIENIHVVRGSLEKLLKVIQEPALSVDAYISGLDKAGWFRHLRAILEAAFFVAARLNEGSSVLVHCSDGWDRTAQVCALAQIILDPYYRTIAGLEALIKKEWLAFGHKFSHRNALTTTSDPREASPIFTLFLDCVRHLCELCPTKFEYNSDVLCLLHDESYAANYGTFVGCSEKERCDLKIPVTTYSIWPLISQKRGEFMNPYYAHSEHYTRRSSLGAGNCALANNASDGWIPTGIELTCTGETNNSHRHAVDMLPSFVLAPQLFRLWYGLFLRWEWRLPKPDRLYVETMSDFIRGKHTLISHRRLLEARIHQLCRLLGRSPDDYPLSPPPDLTSGEESDFNSDVLQTFCLGQPDHSSDDAVVMSNGTVAVDNNEHTNETEDDLASIPVPSTQQIQAELDSVSVDWTNLLRKDIPCTSCGTLLVLVDSVAHCHRCGTSVCSRCIVSKPRNIPGLWSPLLRTAWLCERCSTDPIIAKAKHFTQTIPSLPGSLGENSHPLH